MKRIFLSVLAAALLAPQAARAADEDMDVPLAVTGMAHPSLRTTPTSGELKRSDEYLRSGLLFLKKNHVKRAIDDFNDSVRLAPRAKNFKALGTAYHQDGNIAKAAWAYRESLQLEPDPKVQALVDSFEGKDHPEERFADKNDEVRYARLLKEAAALEKEGRRDSALRGYIEAFNLLPSPEAQKPVFRLAASLAVDYAEAGSVAKAVQVLIKAKHVKERSKDLGKEELANLSRLEKVEDKVVALTGEKLRSHEVDMQTDKERWERRIQEKFGSGKVKIQLENSTR